MDGMRYALRRLLRERAFSALAVGTLALGVGVVSASFAVVDAVLWRPLVAHQNRVVRIWKSDVAQNDVRHPFSYLEFRAFRERSRSFELLSAIQYGNVDAVAVNIGDDPTVLTVAPVSPEFLPLVTTRAPIYGRWFGEEDDHGDGDIAAVVSAELWRRAGAADPAFVGRRLRQHDGRHLVVVGVAPDDVSYPIESDIWVPIGRYYYRAFGGPGVDNPDFAHFELVGRLAPGTSLEQARSELQIHNSAIVPMYSKNPRLMEIVVTPFLDTVVGPGKHALRILAGGAALVLLVAGVNVAALLLMRGARQRREQAVRLALGATRVRLLREASIDSLILGSAATAVGVAMAYLLLAALRWTQPGGLPRLDDAALDGRVLLGACCAVLLWMVTLGTAPAWANRKLNPAQAGDLASRGQTRAVRLGPFVLAEIAAAVVVMVAAGLMVRTFAHLQAIDRGFRPANLAVVPLMIPEDRYPDALSRVALYRDLVARIEALPGVVSATSLHMLPGTGHGGLSARNVFEGQTTEEARNNPYGTFDPVMPTYFQTLGVPIREGRAFTEADSRDAARVAIVSESVAERYWPGESGVGKRLKFDSDSSEWITVVGVAGETRYRELTRPWLTVYFPADQFFYYRPISIVVRSAASATAIVPSVRTAIREREPGAAIHAVETMESILANRLARERTTFAVMSLFAAITLVLAIVGAYGTLSYDVGQRRRELAVRSALGASPVRLFRGVMQRSAGLGAGGAVVGLALAFVSTRPLESLLFEVSPTDSGTFAAAAALVLASACLAALAPGLRAARSAPADVLRDQ